MAKECPKLKNRNADQIASFLLRKYNEEKVEETINDMAKWGFTRESLISNKDNLFKFTVLVAYDTRVFDRPNYRTVWEKSDPESVFSVLERNGILDLDRVRNLSEKELDTMLRRSVAKRNLHLHSTNPRNGGTRYSITIKQIVEKMDEISRLLSSIKSGVDVVVLHQKLCEVHGIKETIASKFIMYTVRDMGIGNIPPSELKPIVKYLLREMHNSAWIKRLEDPSQGGCEGLLEEILEKLRDDPIAIDYFWSLDTDYCSKQECDECGF